MAAKKEVYTGGCLCGAVRYEGTNLLSTVYCHCRMCQKAMGAPFFAGSQFPRESFRITNGEPRWHRSSEVMDRGFCDTCGTPLFVRYSTVEWSDWIGVSIGSFDDPADVTPEKHFGVESRLPWLALADDLPEESYPERFIEEFAKADRENPVQAPSGYNWSDGLKG